MRSLLLRCYPARWRARYGDEFEAILDERPLGPFDVADILLGALDAHLRSRGRGAGYLHGRGISMSLRMGGFAAMLGASLWILAFILLSGMVVDLGTGAPSVLLISGSVVLLVALAGLSAFQARVHPVLSWAAFAVGAVGTLVSIAGVGGMALVGDRPIVAGVSSWYIFFIGLMVALVGSALFAVATYRTAALSRAAAVLLGVGSVLPFVGLLAPIGELVPVVAVVASAIGWFALGVDAVRVDRPATAVRPA